MPAVQNGRNAAPGRLRVWIGLALLAATVCLTVSLGIWQLSRAGQKTDIAAQVQAGRSLPPRVLSPADTAPGSVESWRHGVAVGQWAADKTVLLDNRTAGGKPGFWVVTPLVLDGSPDTALVVMRGWLPRQFPDQALTQVATPAGEVALSGEVLPHVPRLFELSSLGGGNKAAMPDTLPAAGGVLPRVQNLDLAAYAKATGLTLLPVVLAETATLKNEVVINDDLVRDWPEPQSNVDTHRGYALQWFSFAAIAAIAFGVLLVRHLRSSRR